ASHAPGGNDLFFHDWSHPPATAGGTDCYLLLHNSTSYSRSMPCSRFTRSRLSSASASASAAFASSPSVTMKLACFGETTAPPRRVPFIPKSSIILPVPIGLDGAFLKKHPAERVPCGCVVMR